MIIWLTGQPGSGKTTICQEILRLRDYRVFHIDGDDLRDLFENKDYSETGRRKNIELAQQISQYLHNKGKDVLVSLVSPYKDQRDKFKEKMGDNLFEVEKTSSLKNMKHRQKNTLALTQQMKVLRNQQKKY